MKKDFRESLVKIIGFIMIWVVQINLIIGGTNKPDH